MWRRSVPKTVRPFFGSSEIENCLHGVGVRIGRESHDLVNNPQITVEPEVLAENAIEIVLGIDRSDICTVLGEAASSYGLVLTIRDPVFKRRVVRNVWPMTASLPESIELPPEELLKYSHQVRTDISLTICLLEAKEKRPGWPSVVGGWVAKRRFSLHVPYPQKSGFDIRPLTDEVCRLNRLSDGTVAFAEVEADVNSQLEEHDTFATCYLAPSILSAMRADRRDSALEKLIELEIVVNIATAIGKEVDTDTEVVDGSPLEKILQRLGTDDSQMSVERFCDLLSDPQRLRGFVQDELNLVQVLEKL